MYKEFKDKIEIGDTVLMNFVGEVKEISKDDIVIEFYDTEGKKCYARHVSANVVLMKKQEKKFQFVYKLEGMKNLKITEPMTEEFLKENHSTMIVVERYHAN